MMKKVLAFGIAFTPALALAQVVQEQSLTGIVKFLKNVMDTATVLIVAAAAVFFLWNVFKYVMAGGDEEGKNDGRKGMIAGLIGIAIMVSLWGLVKILTNTFGTSATSGTAVTAPPLPF